MKDYINDLIKIGFTESEARIYFCLLKKKNFTATEISKLAHVSRPKVYEVLAKLAEKGLCTETLGRVKKYSAVNPKVGFDKLFNTFEEKKKKVLKLSETLLPLYLSEKENIDPLDYIQVIREKSRVIEKVESLERMAKYEVLMFTKPPYAMNTVNTNAVRNREEFNKLKKGVIYKSIYEKDDVRTTSFLQAVEMFALAGEEVKIAHNLPIKMMVIDERIVILSLRDKIISKPSLTTMVIEHPDLAKAQKEIFNMYWENGMTLKEFKKK